MNTVEEIKESKKSKINKKNKISNINKKNDTSSSDISNNVNNFNISNDISNANNNGGPLIAFYNELDNNFLSNKKNKSVVRKNDKLTLKIGKKVFDGFFKNSISVKKYEKLFEKYKNCDTVRKKYYIYTSFDKILLIFSNGVNKCYKKLNYFSKDEKKYKIEYSTRYYLPNDLFQSQYDYDDILQFVEYVIPFYGGEEEEGKNESDEMATLHFIKKTNMKTQKEFYNIELKIKLNILKNREKRHLDEIEKLIKAVV